MLDQLNIYGKRMFEHIVAWRPLPEPYKGE